MNKVYRWWMILHGGKQPEQQEEEKPAEKDVEKPIATERMNVSEDMHGGTEATESMQHPSRKGEAKRTEKGSGSSGEEKKTGISGGIDSKKTGSGSGNKSVEHATGESQGERTMKNRGGEQSSGENQSGTSTGTSSESGESKTGINNTGESESTYIVSNSMFPGFFNTVEVVDLKPIKRYMTLLRYFFEKAVEHIAEIETSIEDATGGDRYSVRELMLRRYKGKPPTKCKTDMVKESIILILDNSGSMEWWVTILTYISGVALQRRDVEIYVAPNGVIERDIYGNPVNHKQFMETTWGRTIIYIGDYDGANTPIELSWRNRVYWICPEARYRYFASHDWVDYNESDYKGFFYRALTLGDLLDALRTIASMPHYSRRFIDPYRRAGFQDSGSGEELLYMQINPLQLTPGFIPQS